MASDQASSGSGADRHGSGETGRSDDPWQRIETEKPQRDAARKAWDAKHDPSPEYEYAIRPLSEDYGKNRPANRDLTEAQRTELAEVFGRPTDELLALRDKDPRAAHNRDDQGHILDHNGNPRVEKTPEQILREAQRQANLHGPAAQRNESDTQDSPGPPAPATQSAETNASDEADDNAASDGDSDGGGNGGGNGSDRRHGQGHPDDDPGDNQPGEATDSGSVQRTTPPELHRRIGELAVELRTGRITAAEAADQLEQLRPGPEHSPELETAPEAASECQSESETGQSTESATTSEHPSAEPISYQTPTDIHDAMLSGKGRTEVQRELNDQLADPPEEPTTEVVREEGDLRFEKGAPEGLPEDFVLESDDDKSRLERLGNRVSDRSFVEAVDDVGSEFVQRTLDTWGNRVKPTGTAVGIPDDHLIIRETQPDVVKLQGAELMIAPVVLYLVGHHGVRSALRVLNRKQAKEGTDDGAGH